MAFHYVLVFFMGFLYIFFVISILYECLYSCLVANFYYIIIIMYIVYYYIHNVLKCCPTDRYLKTVRSPGYCGFILTMFSSY